VSCDGVKLERDGLIPDNVPSFRSLVPVVLRAGGLYGCLILAIDAVGVRLAVAVFGCRLMK